MTKSSLLKRAFCLFLAFVMCIGLLPVSAVAENDVPAAENATASGWALLNLLFLIATVIGAVWSLLKEHSKDGETQAKKALRLIGVLSAFASVLTFLLTQDLSQEMLFVDKWTYLMAGYAALFAVTAILTRNKKSADSPKA